MKKKRLLLMIIILSLISVFITSCAAPEDSKQKAGKISRVQEEGVEDEEDKNVAKGRYREEKILFSESVKNIFDVECKENGNIKVLSENEPGSFYFYESNDCGISWEQKEIKTEWLPTDYRVAAACFGPDGSIAVSAGKMSEDPLDEKHPVGEYIYFKINHVEDKPEVCEMPLQIPKPEKVNLESGYGLSQVQMSGDGRLYGVFTSGDGEQINYQVVCFDSDNGAVLWKLDTDAAEIALYEDKVYFNEHSGTIHILDAKSGEKLGDISIPLGKNFLCCMDVNTQKDKIFYCNETGIYCTDRNAALSELLVDERLSSFADENYNIKGLFCVNEKVFLMFVQTISGAEMELLRYEYDADLPTQPEHKLVVYSLKENSVIEKIISDFNLSHPDVLVEYEVGMSDAAAKEEADAINSLNTEIMAGNGPDVLILNGLPWESYQEKEILKDLSGDLSNDIGGEKVFENLFSAYRTGEFQYIVPISFKFPVLVGEGEAVSHVNSIEELLKAAEDTGDLPPFFRKKQALLRYIFSIYWQRIEKEEGVISEEELKDVLENVKRINDVLQKKENEASGFFNGDEEHEKNYDVFANDNWLDIWNIKYGNAAMDLGYLSCLKDFADISNQNLSYQAISKGVFSALIAGINRKSENTDIAEEFLEFALSDKEQKIFADGMYMVIMGFPVNRAAFWDMASEPSESELEEYGKGAANFGETFEWQGQEQFEQLEDIIVNLETPAMENSIVIDTILESANAYLADEKTVDAAVDEISRTLELYFLEG